MAKTTTKQESYYCKKAKLPARIKPAIAISSALIMCLLTSQAHSADDHTTSVIEPATVKHQTQLRIIEDGPDPSEAGVGFVVRTELSFEHDIAPTGTIEITSRVPIDGQQASCTITLPNNHCVLVPLAQGTIILFNARYSGDENYAESTSRSELHTLAAAQLPQRVSIGDGGFFDGEAVGEGTRDRVSSSITPDGRFTAFTGPAPDENNQQSRNQVRVYDSFTSQLETLSTSLFTEQPDFVSNEVDISHDGRYVAAVFTNPETNEQLIRLFDRQTDDVIDPLDGIVQLNRPFRTNIKISGNGEWLAIRSLPRLDDNGEVDENTTSESLLFYRVEDGTLLTLPDPAPENIQQFISGFDISTDGTLAVFATALNSFPSPLFNLFTYELGSDQVNQVNIPQQSGSFGRAFFQVSLSGNKAFAFFTTQSSGIVANDNNDASDIYRVNLATDEIDIVSVNEQGEQLNDSIFNSQVNEDGSIITYTTSADNIPGSPSNNGLAALSFDIANNTLRRLQVNSEFEVIDGFAFVAMASDDGTKLALTSTGNLTGIDRSSAASSYFIDFENNRIDHMIPATYGQQANGDAQQIKLVNNGRTLAWVSTASTLTRNQKSDTLQLFIRDLEEKTTSSPISENNSELITYDISEDTNHLAAIQTASTSGIEDVILIDSTTGERILLNENELGDRAQPGNVISVSNDGNYVAWESEDSFLVEGDDNQALDIYLFNRTTQSTVRISLDEDNNQGSNASIAPFVNGQGTHVVFTSSSALVAEDTNNSNDVYRYQISSDSIQRISLGQGNEQALGTSRALAVSDNGTLVLFISSDPNLDPNNPGVTQNSIYLRNTITETSTRIDTGLTPVGANEVCLSPDGTQVLYVNGNDIINVNTLSLNQNLQSLGANIQFGTRCLSQDNHTFAFISSADNIVAGDNNRFDDAFIAINAQSNAQPIAQDDSYTLLEGEGLQIPYFDSNSPIANDFDADQDAIFITGNSAGNTLPQLGGSFTLLTSGSLFYFPKPDQNGTETLSYTISDSINSSNATITISILPVNDRPSFELVTHEIQAFVGSGQVNIDNFAEFNPGAENESEQVPSYRIQNIVNAEALAHLDLNAEGTLSFEFNPLSEDVTVSFDLIVSDDGGTDNGGVDTSAAQQVTITLLQDAIFSSGFEAAQ